MDYRADRHRIRAPINTRDELNRALPPSQSSANRIEDTMTVLSEMGIAVTPDAWLMF